TKSTTSKDFFQNRFSGSGVYNGSGLGWIWIRSTSSIWRSRRIRQSSVPSLAAGLLFGGLAGFGAYQTSQDPKNIWVSLGASGTLAAIMGKRFYNSRKIIPAGLIAGASVLMLAKLGAGMLQKPQQS
uniref:Transmembrane protein 14C n=1 Tax=Cyprinus carpio carpio TaxID=630221 RepID=A0A8C0Y527_CYPCA